MRTAILIIAIVVANVLTALVAYDTGIKQGYSISKSKSDNILAMILREETKRTALAESVMLEVQSILEMEREK